jgi:hypothetical protein
VSGRASALVQASDVVPERLANLAWDRVEADLDARGFAVIEALIDPEACRTVAALYPDDALFRKHVIMARHGYGRGEYKYFAYPLPAMIAELRQTAYPHLARVANRWTSAMGFNVNYPADHAGFLARCHKAGQVHPTPLILEYGPGDFNCLHQDLYGEHAFPLQMAILLSAPERDFTGGQFVLTEQRPRMQSRATVVPLTQGDAVIFAVQNRPVQGTRGTYRVNVRHGVSELLSGQRHTLGIIFHDAK